MFIREIETILVDLATVREHKLANQTVNKQTLVIVRMRTDSGLEGLGEATAIGGMSYGPEAPETIKVAIDVYLAPLLIGRSAIDVGSAMGLIGRHVAGNAQAKNAVEMAMLDLLGKHLGVPVSTLLGGARRDQLEVVWGIATGDADRDIAEAEAMLSARRHREFKIKIGAAEVERDLARVEAFAEAFEGRAGVRVDVNQAWDEATARTAIAALERMGVSLVEQPVCREDRSALRRLSRRFKVPLMADEAVASPREAFALASERACDVFALKLAKSGGAFPTAAVAAIADSAGILVYGGTMLEGTIGSIAAAHLFAALPYPLPFGTELFGPLLLVDDIVEERPQYSDYSMILPKAPGLGVAIDEDKLAFYRRDKSRSLVSRTTVLA